MKRRNMTSIALVLSMIFIITGIIKGQNQLVLMKAIKICLECVGIG